MLEELLDYLMQYDPACDDAAFEQFCAEMETRWFAICEETDPDERTFFLYGLPERQVHPDIINELFAIENDYAALHPAVSEDAAEPQEETAETEAPSEQAAENAMLAASFRAFGRCCMKLQTPSAVKPADSFWDTEFPPAFCAGNVKVYSQTLLLAALSRPVLRSDERQYRYSTDSRSIFHEGICLYFAFCAEMLDDMQNVETIELSLSYKTGSRRMQIKLTETVYPMLAALLLLMNSGIAESLERVFLNNRAAAARENREAEYPVMTLFFALVLAGFLLMAFCGNDKITVDKRVKQFIKPVRESIEKVTALFDSRKQAETWLEAFASRDYLDLERFRLMK